MLTCAAELIIWAPIGGEGGSPAAVVALLAAGIVVLALWLIHSSRLHSQKTKALTRDLQWEATGRRAAEARLAETRDHLELRVLERTADLAQTNVVLQGEIVNRMRAEETLRASEERYRDLFDNANDCVFTTDLEGNYTSVNQTALKLFGFTSEEALRTNAFQLLAPEHRDLAREMLDRKTRGQDSTTYEADVLTRDGRRLTLEFNTRLMYVNGAPVGLQGIARDITERKALEEQLRQSQKMEAIGQLAGGVAHDFNNLLTIVWSYGQMMIDEAPPESPLAEYAQEILLAAERASALTNRLLTFSRRQVVNPRVLDLNAVIEGLGGMLRRLVGEHIEVQTVLAPDLGRVKTDPSQVEQVILNLVVNARDAMPEGGKIRIETKSEHDAVCLSISDTGHGMEAEVLRRLFEPFFTTKAPGKGTGLGLSIVYGIVKQSGGQVSVESSPGKGATFRIRLPEVEEAVPAPVRPQPDKSAHESHGETVLIAEDEADLRQLVKRILADAGYRVLEATNGAEALELIQNRKDAVDVLLTDIIMPRMNGRQLVERMTEICPAARVLYMTGYTDDETLRKEIASAKVPVLQKPFRPDALLKAVRTALADHKPQ